MPAIDFNNFMTALVARLKQNRQRQLLVLRGSRAWCEARFGELREIDAGMPVFSNRDLVTAAIPFSKADTSLGAEARFVVVDLFDGFNPDVLCVAAGLVSAGGVLVLLAPGAGDWDLQRDRYACWQDGKISVQARFVEYFFDALEHDRDIGLILTPGSPLLPAPPLPPLEVTEINNGQSAEQAEILDRIEQWMARDKAGIALVSSDRGRGKSTCLGMLIQRLQPRFRILVSANSRQAAAVLLDRAPTTEFIAPDRLLLDCPPADLVIIDEAAMIPLSMLRFASRLYRRLVMATTTGGYEGTGQGFMLRFVADLKTRGLMRYSLQKPLRWCQDDKLEGWLNQTLMLLPESHPVDVLPGDVDDCEIRLLTDRDDLPTLRRVYSLLCSAHYRTRPSDLRMLMENPDLKIIVAQSGVSVIGVALLNLEGGLDDALCEQVFLGQRRPRGHLLAQMLTAQAGLRGFARYRGARVQRLAVAPTCRRRRLGNRLVERALRFCRENSLDYLGASFALDPETAPFWQNVRCELVHVSYAQGKSTGNHSIAVLRPINPALDADLERLQDRIRRQLPTWMTQFLQTMDAGQATMLLRLAGYRAELDDLEKSEIEAFGRGNKGFELCFASLQKYVMHCIANTPGSIDQLLIEKAVQNRAWDLLERESGSDGRKQLQQRLRGLVGALQHDD